MMEDTLLDVYRLGYHIVRSLAIAFCTHAHTHTHQVKSHVTTGPDKAIDHDHLRGISDTIQEPHTHMGCLTGYKRLAPLRSPFAPLLARSFVTFISFVHSSINQINHEHTETILPRLACLARLVVGSNNTST